MTNEDERAGGSPEAPPATPIAPEPAKPAAVEAEAEAGPEEQIKKLEASNRELKDRLLRTAAEFENFKKRAKKEQDDAALRGREPLLKELLPALDNLERALKHAPEGDPLTFGVKQTEKQILQALEKFGVTRFSSLGKPFDPSLHDAIQQVETSEHPPGAVALEFASGYTLGARLLRPAMVGVAKAPTNGSGESGGDTSSDGEGSTGSDGGGGRA